MNAHCNLVVGLGKTGLSIARWLARQGQSFILYDTRDTLANLAEIQHLFPDTEIFLADLPDIYWPRIHNLICSPGIPDTAAILQKAQQHQIPIIGDIECLARELKAPVIAITGTNGKSTVTTLVGDMAQAAGLKVAVAGNIGTPVLDVLSKNTDYDLWVLELSSFQLARTHSLRPKVASILNISPDHLDHHGTMEQYIAAKQRIYQQAEAIVYYADDPLTSPTALAAQTRSASFSLTHNSAPDHWGIVEKEGETWLAHAGHAWFNVQELRCKGRHFWLNALAASALAQYAGIPDAAIKKVLREFKGLPHRTEWVRNRHGVDWIDDSKGTNVGATLAALQGIGAAIVGKIILLAGGVGKGADFSELAPVVEQYARAVICFGRDGPRIAESLQDTASIFAAADFNEAILLAEAQAQAGDVVLLSPACASFDMFRDFNHRGELFQERVRAL
ncbi:MAG: UDP-N-acetylmuramoyl-L-alanine--D-glutamate ligase [Legionellaceae bacterium]|nr:UDP-N-acetylmuramoyl-L-alanine--D-glutamate ligase [Legionellaceae bacterium]